TKTQRAADATTQMRGDAVEPFERRSALRLGAEHAHEDLCVSQIARNLDARHGDQAKDARILDVVGEKGGDLLTHRSGDAIGAMMVRRHGSPGSKEATGRAPEVPGQSRARYQLCGADSSVRATSSVR